MSGVGNLRRSRVGGWRIIYQAVEETKTVYVVMIERRGQVYKRIWLARRDAVVLGKIR